MIAEPLVSVVMPVHNAEKYLERAIKSILGQTYQTFEFIIIDDGSTDSSGEIIAEFERLDSRIHVIRFPTNQGLVSALNYGLEIAQGDYIARMDADDISLPDRFSKQVEFMGSHPEIGLLGCGMRYMQEDGTLRNIPLVIRSDLLIRWYILFENPFFHPTVMLRRSVIEKFVLCYNPSALHVEDYELWCRMLLHTKGENLADVLLYYRLHPSSVSERHTEFQNEQSARFSALAIKQHLPSLDLALEESLALTNAIHGVSRPAKLQRARLASAYLKLWAEFCRIHHHKKEELSKLYRQVMAWAARMILYPPFQTGTGRALWQLTKMDWRWPRYLITELPHFAKRRKGERAG